MKNHSWLDEFWTLVLALPLILAFTPWFQGFVSRGFVIIGADAPVWYQAAVGSAIAWVFTKRAIGRGGYFKRE